MRMESQNIPAFQIEDFMPPENELKACGYRVLTRGEDAGVDAFVRQGKSLFVFFQGHPEYEANTLLLEYIRDVGRYVNRENDAFPPMPQGYFDRDTVDALTAIRERAFCDRLEDLPRDFESALADRNVTNQWRSVALNIYGNWLTYLCGRKD